MTKPTDPGAIHIPDYAGRPICGTRGGRTTGPDRPPSDPRCPVLGLVMTPIEVDRLPVAVIEPSDENVRWIRA
jgi:hypothetical protein